MPEIKGICYFIYLIVIILNSVEVLATLTSDVGRILSKLHQVQPNGNLSLITGIRIAHVNILINYNLYIYNFYKKL